MVGGRVTERFTFTSYYLRIGIRDERGTTRTGVSVVYDEKWSVVVRGRTLSVRHVSRDSVPVGWGLVGGDGEFLSGSFGRYPYTPGNEIPSVKSGTRDNTRSVTEDNLWSPTRHVKISSKTRTCDLTMTLVCLSLRIRFWMGTCMYKSQCTSL